MVGGRITAHPDLQGSGNRLDPVRDGPQTSVAIGQVGADSRSRTKPSRSSSPRRSSSSRVWLCRAQPRPSGTRRSRVKRTKLSDAVRPEGSAATRNTGPAPTWARSASTSGHGTRSRTHPINAPRRSRGTSRPAFSTVCSGMDIPARKDLERESNSGPSDHGDTGVSRVSTGFKSSCVNIGSKP
jgi:hypothetical protein